MKAKEKYIDFCDKESIPVFSQYWWLDSVCGKDNWSILLYEKGGEIWASFPYCKNRDIIHTPILTQHLGIYIKYPKNQKYYKKLSWEKEIMNYFIDCLPFFDSFDVNFHYSATNWLPFYWKGFQQTTRYTYIIDKNINIEELTKGFETDIRRRRRKAEKLGVVVYESYDIKKFYELNKMTFDRQNMKVPYSFEFIENLYKDCTKNNACKMLFAKDVDGDVIAVNFLVYDKNTVYYLMGGINTDKKNLGGMDLVQHESIKFALETKRDFDFEGSMIESIEKYFRSFGAIQKPYFQISKTNSKMLKIKKSIKDIVRCLR